MAGDDLDEPLGIVTAGRIEFRVSQDCCFDVGSGQGSGAVLCHELPPVGLMSYLG